MTTILDAAKYTAVSHGKHLTSPYIKELGHKLHLCCIYPQVIILYSKF